jgi:uncharacterized protein
MSNLSRWPWLALLLSGLCPVAAPAADPAVNAVIITGENTFAGHKWAETSAALKEILEQNRGFRVTVQADPNFLASNDLFRFDVAVLDFRNEKPLAKDEQARANLVKFLGQGRGLVLVHWASGAFPDWPEYANIAGRCQQRKHDVRGPFQVSIVDHDHPITKGMPDFETDDELFFDFTGERPIHVLATAHSVKTGKDHPMAFVLQYGTARVFHTTLGHDVKALRIPGTSELIRRGTLWAALSRGSGSAAQAAASRSPLPARSSR